MPNLICKLQMLEGRTKNIDETQILRSNHARCLFRATGLLDMQDAPVFEKDRVEIYDDKGDVLFSGVVLYSSQRAAFVLANPETGESYKHTLGELIVGHSFQKVE